MSVLAAFVVPHPPVILPEIGRGRERGIARTAEAYRAAMRRAAALKPDTFILTSPHAALYADYFHVSPGKTARGDFSRFGAPRVRVEARYDAEFVEALCEKCDALNFPAGTLGAREDELDHGTAIPLRFLSEFVPDVKLVRIGLSALPAESHYRLGQLIAGTAEPLDRRVVFIASGDLSHKLTEDGPYGYAPQGPEFDRLTTEALARGDFGALLGLDPDLCERAAECGLRSIWIMAGALDKRAVQSELLSYEGPFGVGYAVAAFAPAGRDDARDFGARIQSTEKARLSAVKSAEDPYVRLARLSLETFVKTGAYADLPGDLPDALLKTRAGAFVSLKKHGQLRGCIGTIAPTRTTLAEEILHNAVSAGTEDPRFEPIEADELPLLVYSVDVLGPAERIDSPDALDPKRYGVIVQKGFRRGLLLPDLEGVDSAAEQIAIAKKKAGIAQAESVELSRFEVVRHR